MKPVLSTEEVVRLEDIIEREGTSKAELMELAGEFAANEVLKLNPDRVLVLVGFGNNGGDGWVAADILHRSHPPDRMSYRRMPPKVRVLLYLVSCDYQA